MYQSIPSEITAPSGQIPWHLTFFKMSDQVPPYVGQLHSQIPHWSWLKCHCELGFLVNTWSKRTLLPY